eukprot:Awhi_evm1s3725
MRAEYIKLKNQYDSLALAHENLKRQWHRYGVRITNTLYPYPLSSILYPLYPLSPLSSIL